MKTDKITFSGKFVRTDTAKQLLSKIEDKSHILHNQLDAKLNKIELLAKEKAENITITTDAPNLLNKFFTVLKLTLIKDDKILKSKNIFIPNKIPKAENKNLVNITDEWIIFSDKYSKLIKRINKAFKEFTKALNKEN